MSANKSGNYLRSYNVVDYQIAINKAFNAEAVMVGRSNEHNNSETSSLQH